MRNSLTKRRAILAGIGLAALIGVASISTTAEAGDRGFRLQVWSGFGGHHHGHYNHRSQWGYGRSYSGPIYHGPSVHYDRAWHHEYNHWTPRGGWHSHGHYDAVPHYVPGHLDYHHYDHIDSNHWYHH